ncbi:MAG: response regulator transcription factor, partial [Propionibacteriales bacterium]|nr:response regulator transcription factor [Propionibacteriales bacterium]
MIIRIVLADDELLLGEAIGTLLSLEDDLEIVERVTDGQAAINAVARRRPDLALLDLEMPILDGIDATTAIRAATPGTRVVLLTRHARPPALRRALAAGVSAFVTKATSIKDLPGILRTVHAGGRYVDGQVAGAALAESRCPLTDRERDVLRESINGATIHTIAT